MSEATASERTVGDVLRAVTGATTVRTVFGEPVDRDGVTVVPVARIRSTGGAGGGDAPAPGAAQAGGSGAGVLFSAKPLGAFVLRDGRVSWRPAVDVNRIVLGGQVVAVVALLAAGTVLRRFLATSRGAGGRPRRAGAAVRGAAARARARARRSVRRGR